MSFIFPILTVECQPARVPKDDSESVFIQNPGRSSPGVSWSFLKMLSNGEFCQALLGGVVQGGANWLSTGGAFWQGARDSQVRHSVLQMLH